LLLPQALSWLTQAQESLSDPAGTLLRGLLTNTFTLVIGVPRLWHLDEMEDVGFALLTGGRHCPSRHTVGGWRRHLQWSQVDAFCRRTSPWQLLHDRNALVSYDEHTIPRWTHKFHITKGYVTTRNKYMRCEKLFYTFDLEHDRYLAVRATRGHVGLMDLAVPLIRQTLTRGVPGYLHAILDAGAGKSDAGVRTLWDLAAEEDTNLDVTLRACRYPHRVKQWKALPSGLFVPYEEPGPYVGAPPKEIRLAETETILKKESAEQAVRTIVCREVVPGPKKDRWHPLYTTSGAEMLEVLQDFRRRQHHEQSYRVDKYDLHLDAMPCGYDKESPQPQRPRFPRAALQLMGWLVALVYNALADLAVGLAGDHKGEHIVTLRRQFINQPGQLFGTPEALIVQLDPFGGQEDLIPAIDAYNAAGHRLPWLENRRVVISLSPQGGNVRGP
jgi:hypothetical protein